MTRTTLKAAMATAFLVSFGSAAMAADLLDKAKSGETVRIGFANEVPWAYPGDNDVPKGFVNAIALGVLEQMGIENIEPVVTDWGGLIPGLKANRFDIITGGMYILSSRCENVDFSDPIGVFGDAFIVAKGNPKGIETYQDLIEKDAIMVTGAGFNTVEAARAEGLADSNVMQVPGPTEILAAVKAGRADAGAVTFFTAQNLAKQAEGEIDVTDPGALPEKYFNWVGIAFRQDDDAFTEAFNIALVEYMGSDAMMGAVAEYGYTDSQLPEDASTEFACENR